MKDHGCNIMDFESVEWRTIRVYWKTISVEWYITEKESTFLIYVILSMY